MDQNSKSEAGPKNAACPLCYSTNTKSLAGRSYKGKQWYLVRCEECDLHFTYPYPRVADIHSFYSGEYHANLLEDGATERAFGKKFERYLESLRPFFPSGRSLDIGCATGLLPKFLRDRGYDAEGLEVNPTTAAWGREHYGIPIHSGTLEEFVISGDNRGSYDLVSLTDVLEHTENPLDAMTRVNSLLKPGGGAMITFPDIRAIKALYYRMLSRLGRREWLWINANYPTHTWEFTRPVATRVFERAGFKVVGFGRSEVSDDRLPGILSIFDWPMLPLNIPALGARFGTQMEFVLKKSS